MWETRKGSEWGDERLSREGRNRERQGEEEEEEERLGGRLWGDGENGGGGMLQGGMCVLEEGR